MSWLDRMQMRFEETGRDTSMLLQETSWFMENQVNAVGNNVRKLCSESSWFVENQVNTVSSNVRKLCSEFVRELLIPTGASPSPCSTPHDESPVKISPVSAGQGVRHPVSNMDKLGTEKKVCTTQTSCSSAALQSNQAAETSAAPSHGQTFKERDDRAQQTAKNLRRRHSKGIADKKENSQGEDVVLGRPVVECHPLRRNNIEKKVELSPGREEIKKEGVQGFSGQQMEKRVKESMTEVIASPQSLASNDNVAELEGQAVKQWSETSEVSGLTAVEECNPGCSDAVEELPEDISATGLTGQSSPESLSLPESGADAPVVNGNLDTCRQGGGIAKATRLESEIDLELLSESEFETAQGQWYSVSDTESVDRKRLGMGRSASAVSLESRRSETGNDFTDWELV